MPQENREKIKKNKLPDSPGVYFFLGPRKKILYIGKATSLRDRVGSYLNGDIARSRGPLIVKMVEEAVDVDFVKTGSVLEALILESNLIKKHQPIYNIKEKDDKSFNYVVITKENYPRVLVVRGRDLEKKYGAGEIKYLFGPFPSGTYFKVAMKIVRKIFPFRDVCVPKSENKKTAEPKPCFNNQIGLCPGICTGEISRVEYGRLVQHLRLFFEGKKSALVKQLEKEMKEYAGYQEFEKAEKTKRMIFALDHIQDVALIKEDQKHYSSSFRIEAYDVAHLSGTSTVGVMTVVENGEAKKEDYRKFKIQVEGNNDVAGLKEILSRRLAHDEWQLPNLIIVDGGAAQRNAATKLLKEAGMAIPVIGVVKNERHKPKGFLGNRGVWFKYEKEILLANAEAHRFAIQYHRKIRRSF